MTRTRRLAACSSFALALGVSALLGAPAKCPGGIIAIDEVMPNTGFQQQHTFGVHGIDFSQSDGTDPLLLNNTIGPVNFTLTTPDGKFTINYQISVSNSGGLPSGTVTGTVFNNTAGQGSLVIGLAQNYQPSPLLFGGAIAQEVLVGNFTEPAFHGNNLLAQGLVNGGNAGAVAVADTGGLPFNQASGFFFIPQPTQLGAILTYNFGPASTPGDAVTIPFTFGVVSPVPEPSTLAIASLSILTALGAWWRRFLVASC
jgi:hypothetical protein